MPCFFIVIHLLRILSTMCENDSIVSPTGYLYKKKKKHYSLYILPIGCIDVSIYHANNESFKIFDSHARDEYGRSHPLGTSVL